MWYFHLESNTFYLESSRKHVSPDKIERTSTLFVRIGYGTGISQMTRKTTKDSVVLISERKKKRRRRGILFSSRKQLQRARMGKRKANTIEADISNVAKVLSYDLAECSSDGALLNISENDRDSIVSVYIAVSYYDV